MRVYLEYEDGSRDDITGSLDGRIAAARVGARRRKGENDRQIALEIGGDPEEGTDGLIGWAAGADLNGDVLVLHDSGPEAPAAVVAQYSKR